MRKPLAVFLVVPSVTLGFMACSSSSSTSPSADASPTSTTTSTSTSSKDSGTPTDSGSPENDAGSQDAGNSSDSGSGVDASFDAGPPVENGCTTYTDNTAAGVAAPGLNWGFDIGTDTNHCSTIHVGQSVSWTGDFTTHPLAPHDSTEENDASANPITSGATTGMSTVTITFPTAGTYGYWCTVHQTMMMGVIRVE